MSFLSFFGRRTVALMIAHLDHKVTETTDRLNP